MSQRLSLDRVLALQTSLHVASSTTTPHVLGGGVLVTGAIITVALVATGRMDAALLAAAVALSLIFTVWHKTKNMEMDKKKAMETLDKLSPREKALVMGGTPIIQPMNESATKAKLVTPRQIVSTLDLKWSTPRGNNTTKDNKGGGRNTPLPPTTTPLQVVSDIMMTTPSMPTTTTTITATPNSTARRAPLTTPSSGRMFGDEHADSLDLNLEVYLEQWIINLKSAVSGHVQGTFLTPLDENAARLAQLQDANGAIFSRHLLDYEWDPETRQLEVATSRAAQLLIHREGDQAVLETLLQKRRVLERYLVVKRRSDSQIFPKGYVLKRLRTLTEGDFSCFSWAGGESWRGKPWSADTLPTDAEIFFRVVCVWLDDLLRHDQSPEFSQQHVRDWNADAARELTASLKATAFSGFLNCSHSTYKSYQTGTPRGNEPEGQPTSFSADWYSPSMSVAPKTFKPHYNIVLDGKIFQVKPGRENVLRAVVHFLWAMRGLKAAGLESLASKVFKGDALPVSPLVRNVGGHPVVTVTSGGSSPRSAVLRLDSS